jgi:acetyl esterase/lipase
MANFLMTPMLSPDDVLKGLPPAFITRSYYDVLHDDAVLYVRRLRQAGVTVTTHLIPNGHHISTIIQNTELKPGSPAAEEAYDKMIKFIRYINHIK